MTDLEKSFPAGQDEISSEKDMKIYEEYIIPTNVSSLGENQDGKEYWDRYEVYSNDGHFDHDFNKLRRWKWCMLDICILILLVVAILGGIVAAILETSKKDDGVQTNTTSFSTTATTSVTISNEAFENEDLNSQDRRFVIDAKETGWTKYFG